MPTLEIKFAIAILIAVFRFGSAHSKIDMEVTHPEKGVIAHWVLVKESHGFAIAHEEEGRLVQSGFVTTFPEKPAKLQFAEAGMAPSVDLSRIIKNFDRINFDQGETFLEAEVEGDTAEFKMTARPDETILFNEMSGLTFKLKGK